MESFTPAFFLQVVIAVGTAGAVYGAIKADLKNMHHRLSEEREARLKHEQEDDQRHGEVHNALTDLNIRVARQEGAAGRK